jgi:hypothetical protein
LAAASFNPPQGHGMPFTVNRAPAADLLASLVLLVETRHLNRQHFFQLFGPMN